jgi:hypothetical protein
MRRALLTATAVALGCAAARVPEGERAPSAARVAPRHLASPAGAAAGLGQAGVSLAPRALPGRALTMLAPAPFAVIPAGPGEAGPALFTSESPGALPAVSIVALVGELPGADPAGWDLRGLCDAYLEALRSAAGARWAELAFADGAVDGAPALRMRGTLLLRSRAYAMDAAAIVRGRGAHSQLLFVEVVVDGAVDGAGAEAARVVSSVAWSGDAGAGEGAGSPL